MTDRKAWKSDVGVVVRQASGYQRVRNRRVGASNREQDPLGAGLYMFSGVRWLDPDEPSEAQLIASGLTRLVRMFPELGCFAAGGQARLEALLRRNRSWWEQSAWKQSRRRRRASRACGPVVGESRKQAQAPVTELCMPWLDASICSFSLSAVHSCIGAPSDSLGHDHQLGSHGRLQAPFSLSCSTDSCYPQGHRMATTQSAVPPFSLSPDSSAAAAVARPGSPPAPPAAETGGLLQPAWRWVWEDEELWPVSGDDCLWSDPSLKPR